MATYPHLGFPSRAKGGGGGRRRCIASRQAQEYFAAIARLVPGGTKPIYDPAVQPSHPFRGLMVQCIGFNSWHGCKEGGDGGNALCTKIAQSIFPEQI